MKLKTGFYSVIYIFTCLYVWVCGYECALQNIPKDYRHSPVPSSPGKASWCRTAMVKTLRRSTPQNPLQPSLIPRAGRYRQFYLRSSCPPTLPAPHPNVVVGGRCCDDIVYPKEAKRKKKRKVTGRFSMGTGLLNFERNESTEAETHFPRMAESWALGDQ